MTHKIDSADTVGKVSKDPRTPVHSRATSAAIASSFTVSKNNNSNRTLRQEKRRSLFHNFDIKPWGGNSDADLLTDFIGVHDSPN